MRSKIDTYGIDISIPLFGERLSIALQARHMSQAELARKCGYSSRRIVNDYVHDLRYPSLGHFYRICEILDISADYLLGLKEELK